MNSNLSIGSFQSGFPSTISAYTINDGCNPVSAQLQLNLDPLISFNSASPPPDSIAGHSLFWDVDSFYNSSTLLNPSINVTTSANAMIGDTVCIEVIIKPESGDLDSTNNIKMYCYPVVNAYDPNDKQVYPIGMCEENYVLTNQRLTYTLRFQNTGNANAD